MLVNLTNPLDIRLISASEPEDLNNLVFPSREKTPV